MGELGDNKIVSWPRENTPPSIYIGIALAVNQAAAVEKVEKRNTYD